MNDSATIPVPAAGDPYRRQARRIRAVHRGDPVKMQQALKNLIAARIPNQEIVEARPQTAMRIDWSTSAILGHRTPAARAFADRVTEKLMCGVLPYSGRRALLRDAARNSITPFEANLIIAAVQHRMQAKTVFTSPTTFHEASFHVSTGIISNHRDGDRLRLVPSSALAFPPFALYFIAAP